MMVENTQCTFLDLGEVTPFLSLDHIQNFCKTIAQRVKEVRIKDFTGTAVACMANGITNQRD